VPRRAALSQPSRTAGAPIPPAPSARRLAGFSLLLAAITFGLYAPVREHAFVHYDDTGYVVDNARVQAGLSWAGVRWAFATGHASNWHPLTWLSHMLDVEWFGDHAGGHHLTSVVLHCVNSVLLLLLLAGMTGAAWRSAFVAAAFAWHPLHVESVAWVAERKDVLSTLFGLLCLWAYAAHARRRGSTGTARRTPFHWLALAAFALGLMSKPMLVTWPFLMLLLDAWPLRRPEAPRRLLLEKLPFFALSLASCIVTFVVQSRGGAVASLGGFPLPNRAANALVSYLRYAGKTLWPVDLAVLYPNPGRWPAWLVLLAAAFLVGVTIAVLRRRKELPFLAVGWLWFVGTLVPVIGLVQVGIQSMADRYTYVPLIGSMTAVAWGAGALAQRWSAARPALAAAGAAALVAWVLGTRHQIGFWKDSESLFRQTLAVTTNNHLALNNLGSFLSRQGRHGEAKELYRASLAIHPEYADAHNNLGRALADEGDLQEAIEHYRAALRADPELVEVHNNLGNALSETGGLDEAIEHYELVLRQQPDHADAHNNLGIALVRKGRADEAVEHFRAAIRLRARYAGAHGNLGNAFAALRRFDEAIAEYETALEIEPTDAETHNNLGNVLVEKGELGEAVGHYREALRLRPDNPEANLNLGHALVRLGRRTEALASVKEALRLRPGYAEARELARALESAPQR
jgi:tetratricopeptide (TPR) repeat protein